MLALAVEAEAAHMESVTDKQVAKFADYRQKSADVMLQIEARYRSACGIVDPCIFINMHMYVCIDMNFC